MASQMGTDLGGIPVSPPGAMSQRTDLAVQGAMDMPNAQYGEAQAFRDIQQAAPMAASPRPPMPTALFAPSNRPDEPVSAGAALGEGVGTEALPRQQSQAPRLSDSLRRIAQADPTGDAKFLLSLAERLGW